VVETIASSVVKWLVIGAIRFIGVGSSVEKETDDLGVSIKDGQNKWSSLEFIRWTEFCSLLDKVLYYIKVANGGSNMEACLFLRARSIDINLREVID
jgi:hypothetical protein